MKSVNQSSQTGAHFIDDEIGSALDESGLSGLEVEHSCLVAKNHTASSCSCTAERDRKPGMTGKIPTLGDWANQWSAQNIKLLRRHDQDKS